VYGHPKTGKTTFVSTFPGPILWLLSSGGRESGELKSVDTPAMRQKITPRVVDSFEVIKTALDSTDRYATIVSDHATGLRDLALMSILGLDEMPVQKTFGMATLRGGHPRRVLSKAMAPRGRTCVAWRRLESVRAEGDVHAAAAAGLGTAAGIRSSGVSAPGLSSAGLSAADSAAEEDARGLDRGRGARRDLRGVHDRRGSRPEAACPTRTHDDDHDHASRRARTDAERPDAE
jgi:hypothetical protein